MKKVLALTLGCLVCMGCQSGGQTRSGTTISAVPPASGTNQSVAAAGAAKPASTPAATDTNTNAAGSNPGGIAAAASTLGRIWQAVGFQQTPAAEPAANPAMERFNGFVNSISTQTSQLNINDPPQVTRQKAEAILTTLRDWDSVLDAGRSVGLINDGTAAMLTTTVARLTAETQKLTQFAPQPETINAVKKIGGSLGELYSNFQGILAQGSGVTNALLTGQAE